MDINEIEQYLKKKYKRTTSFNSGLALFLVDALSLFVSIGIGFFIVNLFASSSINFKSFCNYTFFIPIVLLIFACMGLYPGIMSSPTEDIKNFFTGTFFSFLGVMISILVSDSDNNIKFSNFFIKDSANLAISVAFLISIVVSTVLLPAFREVAKHIFSHRKFIFL